MQRIEEFPATENGDIPTKLEAAFKHLSIESGQRFAKIEAAVMDMAKVLDMHLDVGDPTFMPSEEFRELDDMARACWPSMWVRLTTSPFDDGGETAATETLVSRCCAVSCPLVACVLWRLPGCQNRFK